MKTQFIFQTDLQLDVLLYQLLCVKHDHLLLQILQQVHEHEGKYYANTNLWLFYILNKL